jgi:hypothetical protein
VVIGGKPPYRDRRNLRKADVRRLLMRGGTLELTAPASKALSTGALGATIGAQLGIHHGQRPASVSRRDDPRANVHIIDHVAPGTTIRRRVQVTNQAPVTTPRGSLPASPASTTVSSPSLPSAL